MAPMPRRSGTAPPQDRKPQQPNGSEVPKEPFGLRMRSDSTGSTRGAFYQGAGSTLTPQKPTAESLGLKNKKIKKKHSKKSNKEPVSLSADHGRTPSVAEYADMALASLEEGMGEYRSSGMVPLGTSEPVVGHTRTSRNHRATAFAMDRTQTPTHPSASQSHDLLPETGPTPRLETIRDESEGSSLGGTHRTRHIRSPYGSTSRLETQESLRYSNDNLLDSELSVGNIYGSMSRSDSKDSSRFSTQSLVGTNFLDASITGSFGRHQRHDLYDPSGSRGMPNVHKYQAATERTAPPPPPAFGNASQQQEIAMFSSLVQGEYGTTSETEPAQTPSSQLTNGAKDFETEYSDDSESKLFGDNDSIDSSENLRGRILDLLNPAVWLTRDAKVDDDGNLYFADSARWTIAGFFRHFLYNPISPEFTSLQQFDWAVLLGIAMGVYSAVWKYVIEGGLDFVWEAIPQALLKIGVFTNVDGAFPLYHYMWICPAIFGGILSYIFVILPVKIPDQNEWINSVHSRGVQDYRTFWTLFVLSTLGMLSGLSLGPELPLVLTAGMVGSWLGLVCKQSMLQARVMNLTAASAAVGGFFGFPMAGALFVLEIPHRMGLQYFEALSPATIASIVAVLTNRLVTNNDVTGYYSYPFLTATLPSEIFTSAIVYGLFGAAVGIGYALWVVKLKTLVHDLFHAPHDDHHEDKSHDDDDLALHGDSDESLPLMSKGAETGGGEIKNPFKKQARTHGVIGLLKSLFCCVIPEESNRAAVAGTLAGAVCGLIGIFVPHTMFWGEAQLQNLIDKGRTPLPVFGQDNEPTSALVALGYCMIDPSDTAAVKEGFSVGCAALITISKIIHVGLSLGTGIIGGHFWGPLFVGCAASHFLTDVVNNFADFAGFGRSLAAYPCVVILCTMGSAHVVTFRAHTAIMLILTLTISAFNPEDEDINSPFKVAGDYSAVFPLLVVSVFVALMVSRQTVFYKTQRSRGDIMAVPEVLCEPGMEGRPLVVDFEVQDVDASDMGDSDSSQSEYELPRSNASSVRAKVRTIEEPITQSDIEKAFTEANQRGVRATAGIKEEPTPLPPPIPRPPDDGFTRPSGSGSCSGGEQPQLSSARLDELLSQPMEQPLLSTRPDRRAHRRTQSAPVHNLPPSRDFSPDSSRQTIQPFRFEGMRERSNSGSSRKSLVRVDSYGELQQHQPSLMDQARMRAASSAAESRHRRIPSLPSGRHSRKNSESSVLSMPLVSAGPMDGGALSLEDIEQTFNAVVNQQITGTVAFPVGRSPWTDNNTDGNSTS